MAYFLGPLFGGEVAQYIGFSWLMSLIGCANIGYAIFLFISVFGLISFHVSVAHTPSEARCVRLAVTTTKLLIFSSETRMRPGMVITCTWNRGHRRTAGKTASISDSITQWTWTTTSNHKHTERNIKINSFRTWFNNYSLSVRRTPPSTIIARRSLGDTFVYIAHDFPFSININSNEHMNERTQRASTVLCVASDGKLNLQRKRVPPRRQTLHAFDGQMHTI